MMTMCARYRFARGLAIAIAMIALVGVCAYFSRAKAYAADGSLLSGRVTSSNGKPEVAVPIRAHRENSNTTVSVYTNSRGEYSYPAWSDVLPGSYSITIELPDFELAKRESVTLSSGKET